MSDVFNTAYPLLHIDGVLHQFGQNCIAQHETTKKTFDLCFQSLPESSENDKCT